MHRTVICARPFVEETGASDAVVNMDGSITCGTTECVTGGIFREKAHY